MAGIKSCVLHIGSEGVYVCAWFVTESRGRKSKEIWRAAESASDRETRQKGMAEEEEERKKEERRW